MGKQYMNTLPKPKAAGKPKATGATQPPQNQMMNQMGAMRQNFSYFNPYPMLAMMGMMNVPQQCMQQVLEAPQNDMALRGVQFRAAQVVFVA